MLLQILLDVPACLFAYILCSSCHGIRRLDTTVLHATESNGARVLDAVGGMGSPIQPSGKKCYGSFEFPAARTVTDVLEGCNLLVCSMFVTIGNQQLVYLIVLDWVSVYTWCLFLLCVLHANFIVGGLLSGPSKCGSGWVEAIGCITCNHGFDSDRTSVGLEHSLFANGLAASLTYFFFWRTEGLVIYPWRVVYSCKIWKSKLIYFNRCYFSEGGSSWKSEICGSHCGYVGEDLNRVCVVMD